MNELVWKVEELARTLDIIDGLNGDIEESCLKLKTDIKLVKYIMKEAQQEVDEGKRLLTRQKYLIKQLQLLDEHLDYIEKNKPTQNELREINVIKLPVNTQVNRTTATTKGKYLAATSCPTALSPVKENQPPNDQCATPRPRADVDIAVSYVSNNEFDCVPKYMRGRLTLEDINNFIDTYNSVLNKKYSILNKQRGVAKKDEFYAVWRAQETQELKRCFFCTMKDFDSLEKKKMSPKELKIIIVLRHVRRIKEVRNKKVVYYVACF